MAETVTPYGRAGVGIMDALEGRKKKIDEASEPPKTSAQIREEQQRLRQKQIKMPKVNDREKSDIEAAASQQRAYRMDKGISGESDVELRRRELSGYKKGTRRVKKTGPAILHKGEAVLNVKQARRYRKGGLKGAARVLGAGKTKKSKR